MEGVVNVVADSEVGHAGGLRVLAHDLKVLQADFLEFVDFRLHSVWKLF